MSQFFAKLPFSDITAPILTHQGTKRCADFEMNYVDCLEAYGLPSGRHKCQDFFEDLQECVHSIKQTARVEAMRNERLRQYKAGERSYDNLYLPHPKNDIY